MDWIFGYWGDAVVLGGVEGGCERVVGWKSVNEGGIDFVVVGGSCVL